MFPMYYNYYMLSQPTKVLISIILSVTSIVLYVYLKGKQRKYCMFAMISSSFGDVFMTDILSIGSISTYFGAFFFIVAHIIYAFCFIKASKDKNYKFINLGFYMGLIISLTTFILLTYLMFSKTKSIQGMYFPLLAYLIFIVINLLSQFSYAYNEKGNRLFLMVGMLLFIISDFLVFLPMLNIVEETVYYNDIIWYTYIPAQLLIILFNSNFNKC